MTTTKNQTSGNGRPPKPIGKNGKLPSAKSLLKKYKARELLDMFTREEMIEIFTGNQLLAMAMEIRRESEQTRKAA